MDGGSFVKSTFLDVWTPRLAETIKERLQTQMKKRGRKWPKDTALIHPDTSPRRLAEIALPHVILAVAQNTPMIKAAKSLGLKVLGERQRQFDEREIVQIGFYLIGDVINCTKAIYLITVTKRQDGISLKYPQYILIETKAGFIAEAVADGALVKGATTPIAHKPVPWTNAFDGGYTKDDVVADRRLVHTNEKDILAGLSADNQPRLFAAANTLQAVAYTVDDRLLDLMKRTNA